MLYQLSYLGPPFDSSLAALLMGRESDGDDITGPDGAATAGPSSTTRFYGWREGMGPGGPSG